ncbi:hypothetical protein QC761_206060 [Podospora bellae-mahoneyi]|uniref:t-SNARE coiled-coil homology domain-containing protein n=1 Tax=Podospora bellae-mahoneyi TaxID=2093777 RepID=A0ABR0FPZ0_9PEZI|nr:hypothetical protein QC761_206060 [Podospora bellae-mahoneyi]
MMSSTSEEDPFLQVQQDVLTQLQTTRPLFTSYLRIRSLSSSTTTTPSPELISARAELQSSLESLSEDLSDLLASIRAIETNPSHFNLSSTEITRRKRLVQEVGNEIDDMREELSKTSSSLPDPSSFADLDNPERGEDYAAQFEQEQQVMMMREQDQHLDGVFQTVGNLRRQADSMGRELEEQAEMLEVVDGLADRVGGRLQTGMDKMKYVLKRNEDTLSSCCIGVLILVLVILLVILLIL